jgi:hypothetical protein
VDCVCRGFGDEGCYSSMSAIYHLLNNPTMHASVSATFSMDPDSASVDGEDGCEGGAAVAPPPNRRQQRLRPRQAPPTQGPLTIYALIVVGAGGWHAGWTTADGHALPDADRRARCVQIVVGRWEYAHAKALGFDHQRCRAL